MADETQQKKEVPRMPDGRPMPRDVQIRNELKVLEFRHATALRQLADQVSKVRREELHKNLAAHSANHKVKDGLVNEARAAFDKLKKDAEAACDAAIRKAKGDLQRTLNEGTKQYEETRDRLETALAEQNKPIDEAHKAKDAEIVEAAKKTAQEAQEAYETACKPLKSELAALEEAQGRKAEARAKRAEEQKALKEADEKRAAEAAATP